MTQILIKVVRSPARQRLLSKFTDARREIERALDDEVKPIFIGQLNEVVANWKNKPTFVGYKQITSNQIAIGVRVVKNPTPWKYVEEGTKPHLIRARRAPMLRFPGTTSPKTFAGNPPQWGMTAIKAPPIIRKYAVHHPGNEGRHFVQYFAQRDRQVAVQRIENAYRRAMRR